ncbi:site-specific integrase [Maribellus sediminis]|uniref:site-specific integrase n=1 Tax=Maribellus sediminis TaxID=2696285 RepID=UPI00142F7A0B|nr:site-specific integrase [Maribellus sediminis]
MATIRLMLSGNSIVARLTVGREANFRKSTGYKVEDSNDWIKSSQTISAGRDKTKRELKNNVDTLKTLLNKRLLNEVNPDAKWLADNIAEITGRKKATDETVLTNYFDLFIEKAGNRKGRNGKAVSTGRKRHYATAKNKVLIFDNHIKQKTHIKDVGKVWGERFIAYLEKEQRLSKSTIGNMLKVVKAVCNEAALSGFEVNPTLKHVSVIREETKFVYLSFKELDKIEAKELKQDYLDNARDWLLIGCNIGQRVSDLLDLTADSIKQVGGIDVIELQQKKTGELVSIPISDTVQRIIDKHSGFPRCISAQKFNTYIKKVVELTGIKEKVEGTKLDNVGTEKNPIYRKVSGRFEKHELVTSHICRRSFASNYYETEMPTELIMAITGHKTETQFREYIGLPPRSHIGRTFDYMKQIEQKRKKEPVMNVKRAM